MDKRSPLMFVLGLCTTGLGPVVGVPPGNWSSSGQGWAGNPFAVNQHTGELIWSHQISDDDGFAGSISRTSVAIHGDEVILGDIETRIPSREGANIIAVDRARSRHRERDLANR